jgi:hypothetical protein
VTGVLRARIVPLRSVPVVATDVDVLVLEVRQRQLGDVARRRRRR